MSIFNFNKKLQFLFSALFFLLFFDHAVASRVEISGLNNITINSWAGTSGSLQGSDTYCVRSCTGGGNSCANAARYDVAAYSSGPSNGSGDFFLTREGGGAQPRLQVIFEWSTTSLGPYVMSDWDTTGFTAPPSFPYAPGATSCNQANSQNTITITVPASELATAIAGVYSETFQIDACRLNNWGGTAQCTARVDFRVEIPELIQITKLQNFILGDWLGVGDATTSRDFCVFRNGSGGFSISADGDNDSAGNFQVQSAGDSIPYSIEFSDGGAWFEAVPGSSLTNGSTGFSGVSVRDCGGGTSHTMRINIQDSDLAAATPGNYSDTVTILVQPE